jgi:hypothetical protein
MSYVSNIADSILAHSDNALRLGPEIYTAIAEWEKREIPVEIVLTSIEEVHSHAANLSGGHMTVEMFQDAVIRNFRTWLSRGDARHARAA